MGQNYNLNSSFGFNISKNKGQNVLRSKNSLETSSGVNSVLDSVSDFEGSYEKVFDGTVQKEINMYTRQAMIVGMNLRAADGPKKRFDMNI